MVRDLTVSSLRPKNLRTGSGPPFVRIPAWERKFWGVFMMAGWLFTPIYIVYNLPNYRGGLGPHRWMIRQQQKEQARAEAEAASS